MIPSKEAARGKTRSRRRVIFLANCWDIGEGKPSPGHSLAGQQRIRDISRCLREGGSDVIILSSALYAPAGAHVPRRAVTGAGVGIVYSGLFGLRGLRLLSSMALRVGDLFRLCRAGGDERILVYNADFELAPAVLVGRWMLRRRVFVIFDDVCYAKGGYSWSAALRNRAAFRIIEWSSDAVGLIAGSMRKYVRHPRVLPCPLCCNPPPRDKAPFKDGDRVRILFCGRLDELRGTKIFLSAIEEIDRDEAVGRRLEAIVTGGGPLENETKERLSRLRYVRGAFGGLLPREEFARLVQSTHAGVSAILCSWGGADTNMPSKVFEYLSAGCAVVASDVEELRRLKLPGVLLYSNDDPREMAKRIEEIVRDPHAALKSAADGRQVIAREFSAEALTRRLNDLIE